MTDDAVLDRVRHVVDSAAGTRRALATAIGLDETKLSKALAGRRRFTTAELTAIAEQGAVSLDWLLRGGPGEGPAVTAAPAPAVTPRSPDPDGVRTRILDAVWTLIARDGHHRVRVADVAAAAGVSSAAVHYHFDDRDALLAEALRHNVALAVERQSAGLAGIDDPHARLLRLLELQLPRGPVLEPEWSIWMQVWVEAALDHDRERRELYAQAQDRWYRTVLMTLRDGVRTGAFRDGDDAALERRARQLTALVDGLGIGVMTGASTVDDMRAALHDFVSHSIARGDPP